MANSNKRPWFQRKKSSQSGGTPSFIDVSGIEASPKYGYAGFRLYFPEEEGSDTPPDKLAHVAAFQQYIESHQTDFNLASIETNRAFTVDYRALLEAELDWDGFAEQIVNDTEYCLNCMGLAMHQIVCQDVLSRTRNSDSAQHLGVIRARLMNYEPVVMIKDLRVDYYGKLVSVRGTVIKASTVSIVCLHMAFSCSSCGGTQLVQQTDGVFTPPKKCPTKNCRAQSNFVPLIGSEHGRHVDFQTLKIHELGMGQDYENGRIPRTVDCELTGDLVKCCVPGDDVTVVGIMKVQNNAESYGKSKQSSEFQMYLSVVSVVNNKSESKAGASERITFSVKDYYAIQGCHLSILLENHSTIKPSHDAAAYSKNTYCWDDVYAADAPTAPKPFATQKAKSKIHAEPQLFRFLVQSLCPGIYGHEVVKAGLLLALFGGTKSDHFRAESHVLMMGDPGIGKSQMLKACTDVAPRGVFVCGNTSTNSGLTVTMTREACGEYALEAGALMLADRGCCCIDEFDKMPTQHACLLEAMEQQSISIAKAGVVCSLPTRATILAAANPAGGHYNKAKTVAENLKISSPMLSRFDLIFILVDQSNEELDRLLSEHVLGLRSGGNTAATSHNTSRSIAGSNDENLSARLGLQQGEDIDHLPHTLFRKYIAYAQMYVHPVVSEGAKVVLKDFYFKLRRQFQTGDCTPITTRQLNSLIRLTQARAKVELREEATESDASDVVEIMKHSLIDIFTNDVGIMDSSRSQNSAGTSTKNQVVKLLRLLQQKSERDGKALFTTNEIRNVSEEAGIGKGKFYTLLESLNLQGFILKKGMNLYQLITAEF